MTSSKSGAAFSAEEKAAMKAAVAEAKRAKQADAAAAEAAAVDEAIAAMPPAYTKEGKVVTFFKPAEKFKSRYCALGFEDAAALDDGTFWPTSYAVKAIGPAERKAITQMVKRAFGI